MSGVLLRTGRLREYKALGAVGRPVSSAAPQLRAIVKRRMGAEYANLLAIPQVNEAGDTISWYAPSGSFVVPWSAASEEERAPARAIIAQARQDFAAHSQSLLARPGSSDDAEVLGRMLPLALHIPDESHIHLVDGRPVLTFWGFDPLGAAPDHDVLRDLPWQPAAAAATAAAAAPVLAPVVVSRPWWRWLWLLLPLLLLLALLLFGLRSCGVAVPLPGILPVLPLPTVDAPTLPTTPDTGTAVIPVIPVTPQGGAVLVPGTGSASTPATVDPALPIDSPNKEQNQDKNQDQPPQTPPELPKDQPKDGTAPNADKKTDLPADKTAADKGKDGTTVPPQPLVLPTDAMNKGDTSFLNGHWRSRTGLMDSQTGRPLEVEYDIKDGKGTATIERSDGVKCAAPVTAAIAGGQLTLNQTAAATCPDGQVFDPSKVACKQGKDGKADCQGLHADGSDYSVQIVK